MKKNIINTFLAVAIALMTILFYNSMTGIFKPIRTETKYTSNEYGAQTYIFHSDGTFDEIVVRNGEEETGYGMYAVDGDTIHVFFIMAPYWQTEQFTMQIEDNGASLKSGDRIYKAGFYMTALYAVLTGISEIGLIAAVFVINKKCS